MFRWQRTAVALLTGIIIATPLFAGGNEPELLVGTVVIRPGSGPAPFVLVAIDVFSDGDQGDGVIDHVYKYYSSAIPDLSDSFEMAVVQHEEGRLTITAPARRVKLSFILGPAPQSRGGRNDFESVFAGGSGLSHYWDETARRGSIRKTGPQTYAIGCGGSGSGAECFNDWDNGGSGSGGCQAGGVGATSCSLSVNGQSCSIECHLGYACCKYANGSISCTCVM